MKWGKILLAAVILWVVSTVYAGLTCGWLFTWIYEIPPIVSKTPEEMMAGMNMVFMYGLSLVGYFFFAMVFAILYKGIPGKGVKKGLMYGLLLWLVTAFLGMATMPFYMNIAPVLVIYWIAQALIMDLVGGAILGAIYKK